MKSHFRVCLLVCLASILALAQQPKAAAPQPGATALGKLCDDPYSAGTAAAESWPTPPLYILFHHENSKAPWAHNPVIHLPGLEAATPAAARTLVCVEESRVETGKYDSGEAAYRASWDVVLVDIKGRKAQFMRTGFYGEDPPGVKYHRGAGVGKPPVEIFSQWLRLAVDQKVAVFKRHLKTKQAHEISALAFSANGSKLVAAQEPRSSILDGTQPTPVTVFDVATGQANEAFHPDFTVDVLAVSDSGTTVAISRYGQPQLWDVSSPAKPLRVFEADHMESLVFGPNNTLGAAGTGKAFVWDAAGGVVVRSSAGSRIGVSPQGEWIVSLKTTNGITVQNMTTGAALGSFPAVPSNETYAVSGDGQSMAHSSIVGGSAYLQGVPQPVVVHLPNLGVDTLSAAAPARDGFVFANQDGFVGVLSAARPQIRAFATDHTAIHALAVSRDGRLLAIGDSSGEISIWELQ